MENQPKTEGNRSASSQAPLVIKIDRAMMKPDATRPSANSQSAAIQRARELNRKRLATSMQARSDKKARNVATPVPCASQKPTKARKKQTIEACVIYGRLLILEGTEAEKTIKRIFSLFSRPSCTGLQCVTERLISGRL